MGKVAENIMVCLPSSDLGGTVEYLKGQENLRNPPWHVVLLDDSADLWLKAHVQHSVRLIETEIPGT